MTEKEAMVYLSIQDKDEAEDVYEEKLFALKQFFLNRFPVSKLIKSKLATFKKVQTAYEALEGETEEEQQTTLVEFPQLDSLKSAFSWYHQEKNAVRLQLLAAQSHKDVEEAMMNYVQLAQHYAKHWQIPLNEDDHVGIAIGSEPDAMEIQAELNAQEKMSENGKMDILSLPDENCLKSEAKRLSLWLKFEINE